VPFGDRRLRRRQQRIGTRRPRPESEFDAQAAFEASVEFGTPVEINSRPERLDPRSGCSHWPWSSAAS